MEIIDNKLMKIDENDIDENGHFIIPDGIISIGERVFNKNKKLKSVFIPNSLIEIGQWAFSECSNLEKIIFSKNSNLKFIRFAAFLDCKLLEINSVPDSVEIINQYAFYGCEKNSKFIFPKNIKVIEPRVFNHVKDVEFPNFDNIVKIGDYTEKGSPFSRTNNIDVLNATISYEGNVFNFCFDQVSLLNNSFLSDFKELFNNIDDKMNLFKLIDSGIDKKELSEIILNYHWFRNTEHFDNKECTFSNKLKYYFSMKEKGFFSDNKSFLNADFILSIYPSRLNSTIEYLINQNKSIDEINTIIKNCKFLAYNDLNILKNKYIYFKSQNIFSDQLLQYLFNYENIFENSTLKNKGLFFKELGDYNRLSSEVTYANDSAWHYSFLIGDFHSKVTKEELRDRLIIAKTLGYINEEKTKVEDRINERELSYVLKHDTFSTNKELNKDFLSFLSDQNKGFNFGYADSLDTCIISLYNKLEGIKENLFFDLFGFGDTHSNSINKLLEKLNISKKHDYNLEKIASLKNELVAAIYYKLIEISMEKNISIDEINIDEKFVDSIVDSDFFKFREDNNFIKDSEYNSRLKKYKKIWSELLKHDMYSAEFASSKIKTSKQSKNIIEEIIENINNDVFLPKIKDRNSYIAKVKEKIENIYNNADIDELFSSLDVYLRSNNEYYIQNSRKEKSSDAKKYDTTSHILFDINNSIENGGRFSLADKKMYLLYNLNRLAHNEIDINATAQFFMKNRSKFTISTARNEAKRISKKLYNINRDSNIDYSSLEIIFNNSDIIDFMKNPRVTELCHDLKKYKKGDIKFNSNSLEILSSHILDKINDIISQDSNIKYNHLPSELKEVLKFNENSKILNSVYSEYVDNNSIPQLTIDSLLDMNDVINSNVNHSSINVLINGLKNQDALFQCKEKIADNFIEKGIVENSLNEIASSEFIDVALDLDGIKEKKKFFKENGYVCEITKQENKDSGNNYTLVVYSENFAMPVSVHLNSKRINSDKMNMIEKYCESHFPTICVCNLNGAPLEINNNDYQTQKSENSNLISPGYYDSPDEKLLEKIMYSNYYNYNLEANKKMKDK